MVRNEEVEARLNKLAAEVLKDMGQPTKESDMALAQAFVVYGIRKPEYPGTIDLETIVRKYGWLGWLFDKLFGKRADELLKESIRAIESYRHWCNQEIDLSRSEHSLRASLLAAATQHEKHVCLRAEAEAERIRDRASKAASKARDKTVVELRQILLFGHIRLIQRELIVAQQCQMTEVAYHLRQELDDCFQAAREQWNDIAVIATELSRFDALIADSGNKPTR